MTTIAIIKLVGAGIGILSTFGLFFYVKNRFIKGDKAIKQNKSLKKVKKIEAEAEQKKTGVREEHDEKANNIINNPNSGIGGMSNTALPHNHSFRGPCTQDCPAYKPGK